MYSSRESAPARSARPTPALLVAIIALVAALGGSALALPGKNKIDKNDIQKGAVTKKALKKSAVTSKAIKDATITAADIAAGVLAPADGSITTAKLADGAATGAKVDEASLGKVPSATAADSAATTDEFDTGNVIQVAIGQTVTFVNRGPATLKLACNDADANTNPEPVLFANTTENNSAWGILTSPIDNDLDVGENTPVPIFGEFTAPTFQPSLPYALATPSGRYIEGSFGVGGKGVLGSGNGCVVVANASG